MGRRGLAGRVAAAFLLDLLVLTWFPLWGVRPRLLPGLVFLIGADQGPDRGAAWGLLAGGLCWLAGGSPWQLALLTLCGAVAGEVVPAAAGFWARWGAFLLLLLAGEGALLLGHWLGGDPLGGLLPLAGAEGLLLALCFPPAALLLCRPRRRQTRPRRRRRRGRI